VVPRLELAAVVAAGVAAVVVAQTVAKESLLVATGRWLQRPQVGTGDAVVLLVIRHSGLSSLVMGWHQGLMLSLGVLAAVMVMVWAQRAG
jgi:hypothetical protein